MGGPGGGARLRLRACRGPAALARAAGVRVDDVRGDGLPRNVRGAHEVHAALAPRLQRAVPPPGVDRQGVRLSRRRVAGTHRPRGRGRVECPRVRGARRPARTAGAVSRGVGGGDSAALDRESRGPRRPVLLVPRRLRRAQARAAATPADLVRLDRARGARVQPLGEPGPRPHRPARGRLGAAHLFHAREGDDRSGPSRPGVAAHRGGNAGGGAGTRGASRSSTRTGAT